MGSKHHSSLQNGPGEGVGHKVGIPYGGRARTRRVRAVRDWRLYFSLFSEWPLFRPVNPFSKILPSRLTA
jgi:hypothetical protein